jgi:diguanylate cyclase (GGDEF)-like protein/PAS domain S-box-containing protein
VREAARSATIRTSSLRSRAQLDWRRADQEPVRTQDSTAPHPGPNPAPSSGPGIDASSAPDAGQVFDEEREGRLDADRLERVLSALVKAYPDAPVAALSETGIFVDMPESLNLEQNPVLKGRSGLDGVEGEERDRLVDNWDRILTTGASRCVFQPTGHPSKVTLFGLDLRERHGVVLTLLVGRDSQPYVRNEENQPGVGSTPRFASVRKSALSVITHIDEATSQILGWTPEEMEGRRSLEFVHPDDHSLAVDNWMQMLARPGPARRVRQRLRNKDGSWTWFEVTNHNLLDDPAHDCVVCEMVDVSDEMAAHEELRAREQLLDRLAEAVPVGLFQIDADGRVVYANDRLREIFGTDTADTVAAQLTSVVPADRPALDAAIAAVLEQGSPADVEVALRMPESDDPGYCTISLRALTHEDDSVSGAIACVADVTDSTRMREELRHRATVDELTGCQNRAAIMRALEANIASGQRRAERAVLFIDLDGFKQVNDEHGHAAGDELLRRVAERLRSAVRDGDIVGRIGGDEFLIVCPEIGGHEPAVRLAQRIAELLRRDVALSTGGRQASIGVAWSSGEQVGAEALIARADRAMYESKRERAGRPTLAREPELAA